MYKRKQYKSDFTSMKENEQIINLLFRKPNNDSRESKAKDERILSSDRQGKGSACQV